MPVDDQLGISDGEIERGVNRLRDLRPRCEIGPGDQVEAARRNLTVWHEPNANPTDPTAHPIFGAAPRP